ncbi:MAG: lycopene cyclase domain-containing protein [Spirosomataceae bacterium]
MIHSLPTYLLLDISFGIVWLLFLVNCKKLRSRLLKTSFYGGFFGLIAEQVWYFQDYWHPKSLFGVKVLSIEDFLFGFFVTGICATIYRATISKKWQHEAVKTQKGAYKILFIVGTVCMVVLTTIYRINSIFSSSGIFLCFALLISFLRKDLFIPSLASGILTLLIVAPIYAILFNYFDSSFWETSWVLYKTQFDKKIGGNIPLTELLWYFSWGCFSGVSYDFVYGIASEKQENNKALNNASALLKKS